MVQLQDIHDAVHAFNVLNVPPLFGDTIHPVIVHSYDAQLPVHSAKVVNGYKLLIDVQADRHCAPPVGALVVV